MGMFDAFNSDSTSTTIAPVSNTDSRKVLGQSAINAEGSSAVNYTATDLGAIGKAFDFADRSLKFAAVAQVQALDNINANSKTLGTAYENAKGRGALTDYILIAAIVMAGIVAFQAVTKG